MDGWLAADIGGTKLAAAAFDGERLLCRQQEGTRPENGAEDVLDRLADMLARAARGAGIRAVRGVGVACPGPLSPSRGVVICAPTLNWRETPVKAMLEERLHCPALLENDANAAALGEYALGAGRGCGSMAYITVSTGVGCGLVFGGRILEGAHEGAGELGHLVLNRSGRACPCGRRGCLERYASGTAIGEDARKVLRMSGRPFAHVTAKEAADMARAGDAGMLRVFEKAGDALGRGIAALQQLCDVERIVIGGSASATLDLMKPALLAAVRAGSYWGNDEDKWLFRAKLGPDAGLAGAGTLAMQRWNESGGNV